MTKPPTEKKQKTTNATFQAPDFKKMVEINERLTENLDHLKTHGDKRGSTNDRQAQIKVDEKCGKQNFQISPIPLESHFETLKFGFSDIENPQILIFASKYQFFFYQNLDFVLGICQR